MPSAVSGLTKHEAPSAAVAPWVTLAQAARAIYDGFTAAGSVQLGYNDLNSESDPRAAFLISNTFADDTFGILVDAIGAITASGGAMRSVARSPSRSSISLPV